MKKFNKKTSTKIVAIILAAVAACSVMGCSVEKTVTTTETYTDAAGNTITATQTTDKNGNVKNGTMEVEGYATEDTELITYDFETFDNVKVVIDENSILTQEPSDDPEYSDLVSEEARGNLIAPGRDFVYLEDDNYYYVADLYRHLITVADKSKAVTDTSNDENLPENPGFFETDSWSITYDTDKWYGYVSDRDSTIINYIGECAGTSLIEITEADVATASEAVAMLEEKNGMKLAIDDIQEGKEYSCFAYVDYGEYNPEYIYIDDSYYIYEHNGKVIILNESITHDFDKNRTEALAELFADVIDTFVLK